MRSIKLAVFICAILSSSFLNVFGQKGEKGLSFIDYYSPDEYKAGSFNYNVVKDSLGIYYFSNEDGILIYNGLDWNLVRIAGNKPVYWVEMGIDGTIYVGSDGEFGYLKFASNGTCTYISLMGKVPTEFHDFSAVWEVATTSKEIVFRSKKYLFLLSDDQVEVITPFKNVFDIAFTIRDTVYTREVGTGVLRVEGNEVKLVKGGEYFADKKVNIYLPHKDNQLLVGTRYNGLYILDQDGSVAPLKTEVDDFLKKYKIYHGCVTHDGNYSFAAYTKGVVIIDQNGKLLEFFDQKSGLVDFQYLFVGMFDANNMWIANGVGTSRVELLSPLSYFDTRSGLKDVATDAIRYNGEFYVSTFRSLYKLQKNEGRNEFVRKEMDDIDELYSLDEVNGKLVVGSQRGLRIYENGVFDNSNKRRLHYSNSVGDDKNIWIGDDEAGLGMYQDFEDGDTFLSLAGFNETIKKVVPLGEKVVFITKYGKVGLVSVNEAKGKRYLKLDQQFEIVASEIVAFDDNVLIIGDSKFYLLNSSGQLSDPLSLTLPNSEVKVKCVEKIKGNKFWVCYQDDQRNNFCDQVIFNETEIKAIGVGFNSKYVIKSIYSDIDQVTWFMGDGGALRYDRKIAPSKSTEIFECHIGSLVWQQDSIIFENGYDAEDFEIPYNNTELRFSFFTNQLNASSQNLYQYYLVGRDDTWSNWSTEWKKDYTDLPPGEYIFHVRAKNPINQISELDAFQFIVKEPWYMSKYSILWFTVIFMGFVFGLYKIRTTKMKEKEERLERLVSRRTYEVEAQKKDLEKQQLILQNANDTKNQLFSIIGHDLRSPLSSIQGLTDLIQHYYVEKQPEMMDDMMKHLSSSVKGLRHLLDNLLTWALNQSGNFKINPDLIKVELFLKEIISILIESAKSKNIEIHLKGKSDCLLSADRNSLSTVMRNLINNAIKFSHENSVIEVSFSCDHEKTVIQVKDYGIGIPSDKLEKIYELTTTTYGTNNEKGTGLGLVLVSEFVALNGGTINVESEEGKGTTFQLEFPNK
jgi:signal transduction histidine kinase